MTNRDGVLAMYCTPDQIPLHGAITTSYTNVGKVGTLEGKAVLAKRVFEQLESHSDERTYLKAADALAPAVLSKRALVAVTALPEFSDSLATADDLLQRYAHLRNIESGHSSSTTRTVLASIREVLGDHYDALRRTLSAVFDNSPGKVRDATSEVRKRLTEVVASEAPLKQLPRLCRLLRTYQAFCHCEGQFVPEPFGRVQAALLGEARASAENALGEVTLRQTMKLSEQYNQQLETTLKDLEAKAQAYQKCLADIDTHLDGRRKEAAREQAERMSTACLFLRGPSKDEVLTGVKSALSCTDLTEVTSKLAADYEARVREYARKECPHIVAQSASTAVLMLEVGPAALLRLMDDTVEDNLGHGHSPYQLLEAYGLDKAVQYLYTRAAPTCSFSGRDSEGLGVSTDELSIVRLPRARAPEDDRIRTELKARFDRLPKCKVVEGSEAESELLLTRVQGGWPIGIEDANGSLLMAYLESDEHCHIPHLLRFLPDSPLGRVIPTLGYFSLHQNPGKDDRDVRNEE